ncbi:MAG: helix-turn-helix domain-containing protein [Thermoleophilia bacterium]
MKHVATASEIASIPDWPDLPPVLTLPEVAAVCRISVASTYESCRSGFLRPVAAKVGNQWRIPRDSLRRLLEGGAQ